ncbi:MAG: hypothetical protein Q8R06_11780 [Polaromonas sp.]|uniref:hypothetical protein n=1 Tax=Polaromonas sp. TaxID=1869339 RepID=UPI002734D60C|nr:hypothetical protein [Polaromonas sp.]MDP3797811.1 hypothetical protein [Polaromonas sp.]
MKMLINNGQVIDPVSGFDEVSDVAVAAGRIVSLKGIAPDFHPTKPLTPAASRLTQPFNSTSLRLIPELENTLSTSIQRC